MISVVSDSDLTDEQRADLAAWQRKLTDAANAMRPQAVTPSAYVGAVEAVNAELAAEKATVFAAAVPGVEILWSEP